MADDLTPQRVDPFESLRRPITPLDPDLGFAARLRGRLERAASAEGDAAVTAAVERRQQTLTPYLAVSPAAEAIDWYVEVFGAVPVGERYEMPDGRVGHAELMIGDSLLMLADAHPEIGHTAPTLGAGTHVMLTVQVSDAEETVSRARSLGARVDREVSDTPYGHRGGVIRDPFGHRWSVQSPLSAVEPIEHGDLAYFSLHVPDPRRAIRFYESVLGWEVRAGADGRSAQVEGQNVHSGFWGEPWPGVESPGVMLVWTVSDIERAAAAVRTAGGTAGEIDSRPYGLTVDCVDNQGLGFALHQDHPGAPTPKPIARKQGDLEYFTIGSADDAATSEFYGTVLGWRFEPGHVEHGRQIVGSTPLGGVWGGDMQRQRVQLMFRVDDIAAAVERVRRAGGTATDPQPQPYGVTSDCVDDQGLAFWVIQAQGSTD